MRTPGKDAQERIARAALIVSALLMAIALLWRYGQTRIPPGPRPTASGPAPTFTLAPAIGTQVAAVGVPYLCPFVTDFETLPKEVAPCKDCLYYPVDKAHGLPATYRPQVILTGLKGGGYVLPVVKTPLAELFKEAQKRGIASEVTSGYRSYREQAVTFSGWVAQELTETGNQDVATLNAARYSARPGHSEHQLGSAIDVNCATCTPFDDQDEDNLALWRFLEEESHKFGFVLSYPRDIEALTGYMYEPWHIRYVGVQHATTLYNLGYLKGSGVCLAGYLRDLKLYQGQ